MDDDTIVFTRGPGVGMQRVPVAGGTPTSVIPFLPGEGSHSFPAAVAGSSRVLFTVERDGLPWDSALIAAVDVQSGKRTTILQGATKPRFIRPDWLLFQRAGKLMATRLDLKTLTPYGESATLVEELAVQPGTGDALFSASENGTIAFLPGDPLYFSSTLLWVDRAGHPVPLAMPPRPYAHPRLAPDGTRVLVQVVGANDDLWIYDLRRSTMSRMTFSAENLFPVWSPDGRNLSVTNLGAGKPPMPFIHSLSGDRPPRQVTPPPEIAAFVTSWTSDGSMAMVFINETTQSDIFVIRGGGGKPVPLVATRFQEHSGALSPDGKWLAYTSDESGESQIYIRATDGSREATQVSASGGTEALWTRGGKEIVYRSGSRFVAVAFAPGAIGEPQLLFEGDYEATHDSIGLAPNYDVSPDGNRFLVVKAVRNRGQQKQLEVILNWPGLLKEGLTRTRRGH